MAEIINGVPIGDLPGIGSVPDDSMLVVEFLGKAYHMPGAVLRQMIQDVLDSMGDSVDDVTEARLTAAIETVLSSGKYNGVSPSVEVLDEEDGTTVIHIIDAFGVKKYPVEVKGARNAVQYVEQELTEEQKAQARENIGIGEIGNSVVVELSGNPTDGYTALLSGEAVTGDELDEMAKNGSHITGVATESLVFQVSNGINGTSYTVPNGTIFSYGNAIVTGNPGFYGTGGVHSFEFRVCLQDYNFAIAYKAVANQDEKVWVSATQATHMVFRLGISQGIPAVLYGTQMLYGNSVPNMNYLYTILAESQLLNRPVFCYQVNMPFYTDDGTEMTPYSGVLFSLKINSAYQYFFEAEHEGYVYRFTVKQNEGYSCTAEPTEVYKKVQSKADDLKAEDGTLFLLSAGEPIGSGVPIPSGGTSEAVQYVEQTLTDEQKAQARSNIGAETAGAAAALAAVRYVAQAPTDTQKAQARSNIGAETAGAAAALPAVKYEAQTLTDVQKAQARSNIGAPDDNIFIADYETTTYAEIKAAYDARKTCFTSYDGSPVCQLVSITDAEASFICPMSANQCLLLVFTSDGQRYTTQSHDSAVRYNEQGLTNNQKAQARSNIGAEAAGAAAALPAVKYEAQTLTDAQKAQARSNIGAETAGAAAALAAVRYVAQAPTDTQKAQARSNIGAETAGTAAALPAVKYEAQTLTDAQKAQARSNIGAPDDNIFIADYETTTYAEIKAAYDARKTCFTSYDGSPVCQLVSITDAEASFICPMSANQCLLLVFTSDGPRYSTQSHDSAVRYNEQGLTNNQKSQARSNIGAVGYTAPTNVAGTEQVTAKLYTSNGGSISFGKDGPNSGTMIRLDQADGTCRLRFRASDTAGAMVWEQPEQGAQLYVDLGANGSDKHRITFPSSGGTLALTSGNVNTATIPLGFSSRKTNGNWGNTDGTTVTCWIDPTGGGVDFRRDNPSYGKLSMKLDGRVYVNEGKNPVMGTEYANGFWGITSPDGENNVWIRTTTQGIIPYQNGGAGSGHCNLGTSSWYFANAYIDKIYGSNFSGLAAKATADANGNNIASTYASKTVANTFDGEQKMINSTHCPTMNDIAAGVGCSLKNARACDNQLIVAEIFAPTTTVTDSKINMSAVAGEIGFYHGGSGSGGQFTGKTQLARITSAGIYEGSTLLSDKYLAKSGGTLTGNLTVGSAKIQTNGYVIGTWLQTTAGNASSAAMQKVCVQSPDGWIYTRTLDQLRGDMGAAGAPLKVTLSGSASSGYSVDKTVSEIAAAWNAGRNVYLTDGVSIYNLSLLQGVAAASFTGIWATTLNGKSTLTVETVLVASNGKVVMYSYSA